MLVCSIWERNIGAHLSRPSLVGWVGKRCRETGRQRSGQRSSRSCGRQRRGRAVALALQRLQQALHCGLLLLQGGRRHLGLAAHPQPADEVHQIRRGCCSRLRLCATEEPREGLRRFSASAHPSEYTVTGVQLHCHNMSGAQLYLFPAADVTPSRCAARAEEA